MNFQYHSFFIAQFDSSTPVTSYALLTKCSFLLALSVSAYGVESSIMCIMFFSSSNMQQEDSSHSDEQDGVTLLQSHVSLRIMFVCEMSGDLVFAL